MNVLVAANLLASGAIPSVGAPAEVLDDIEGEEGEEGKPNPELVKARVPIPRANSAERERSPPAVRPLSPRAVSPPLVQAKPIQQQMAVEARQRVESISKRREKAREKVKTYITLKKGQVAPVHAAPDDMEHQLKQIEAEKQELEKKLKELELDDIPEDLLCPICQELMVDPVVATDGYSYERKAIETWLKNHGNSPVTGVPLASKTIIPNLALKSRIEDFCKRFPHLL